MRRTLSLLAAAILLCGAAGADDIVTMPTANQLRKGEVDAAVYYLDLDLPEGAPRFVQYQTLYLGLTDRLEIDLHRAAVDRDKTSIVTVASYRLLREGPQLPDLVVGVRNLLGEATTNNPAVHGKSERRSFYLAAARTVFLKPEKPGPPLVRVHAGLGTADWTLLGEKRHEGLFGGLQFLLHPMVGAVIQHDGTDLITGLTLMPPRSGLTIKGGTYGKHTWVGVAWRKQL